MEYKINKFLKSKFSKEKDETYLMTLWILLKYWNSNEKLSNKILDEIEKKYSKEIDFTTEINEIQTYLENDVKGKEEKKSSFNSAIKSISIRNFRGFGSISQEDRGTKIDFHNKKNIIFGSNGSGKSSLCEALEFALTKKIKEAKRRNISIEEYTTRNSERSNVVLEFYNPKIKLENASEYETYEFEKCFIEKNRINEFALLSGSKDTGEKGKDIVARILGFEELDELKDKFIQVSQFRSRAGNIKKDLAVKKAEELSNQNRDTIIKYKHYLDEKRHFSYDKKLALLEFNDFRIQQLEKIKSKITNHGIKNYTLKDVKKWLWIMLLNKKRYEKNQEVIKENASKLDFKNLFQAVLNLESISREKCPACNTPISNVTTNPFEFAKTELEQLRYLDKHTAKSKVIEDLISNSLWGKLISFKEDFTYAVTKYSNLKNDSLTELFKELTNCRTVDEKIVYLDKILSYSKTVDLHDFFNSLNEICIKESKSRELNDKLISVKLILEKNKVSLQKDFEIYKQLNFNLKQVFDLLIKYIVQKKEQDNKVILEGKYNSAVDSLIISYKEFYEDLVRFILEEQKQVINAIEDKILKFYQQINEGDSPIETISKIEFAELKDSYEIQVKINSCICKAANVLSEGHLRSLGLSIILATAESSKIPFIIFDDVVNAIDSEHRANIIKMFSTDLFLKQTQLIITTHDRLFWERYCNQNKFFKSYSIFYSQFGTCFVEKNISYKNKIEEALTYSDIKEALIYSRIWFENICKKYCLKREVPHKIMEKVLWVEPSHLFNIIKTDFKTNDDIKFLTEDINWTSLNQEHHSFSEYNYNLTHSYTSTEVKAIFEAVNRFNSVVEQIKSI